MNLQYVKHYKKYLCINTYIFQAASAKISDTSKLKRKFSSFFKSLVIELDKELYGPDNHLVEVIFYFLTKTSIFIMFLTFDQINW